VLPPDASAWRDGDVRSGSGSSPCRASGAKPAGTLGAPGAASDAMPTTSAGFASARIALRSFSGSFHDTGCGTAPSFQIAKHESTNSGPFGSAIVTKSPCATPRSA
jgi:hypothetical protein